MATTHIVVCEHCGAAAELSQPGRFCSAAHRVRAYRDNLLAQRRRLAAEAGAALASGDVAALEQVARRTVHLLAA